MPLHSHSPCALATILQGRAGPRDFGKVANVIKKNSRHHIAYAKMVGTLSNDFAVLVRSKSAIFYRKKRLAVFSYIFQKKKIFRMRNGPMNYIN